MKKIKLTRGYSAIIDDEDCEYLNQWKWHVKISGSKKTFYAYRTQYIKDVNKRPKCISIAMHREILNTTKIVDHINHNGLDNRKENLRICKNGENSRNARKRKDSKQLYKGVSFDGRKKLTKPWRAGIFYKNKSHFLGMFKNKEDAALAYNLAAALIYKEFAYYNKAVLS